MFIATCKVLFNSRPTNLPNFLLLLVNIYGQIPVNNRLTYFKGSNGLNGAPKVMINKSSEINEFFYVAFHGMIII